MKKLLLVFVVLLMSVGSVYAPEVGNPDNECQNQGFDFGIAKFECDNDDWSVSEDDGFPPDGYDVSADGEDCSSVDWESDPAAAGIIEKAGQDVFIHDGGFSGTVEQSGRHEISHITLCGDEDFVIPEFGGIAAGLAFAGAGAGYMLFRRRK